jgi:hypothetical protein
MSGEDIDPAYSKSFACRGLVDLLVANWSSHDSSEESGVGLPSSTSLLGFLLCCEDG